MARLSKPKPDHSPLPWSDDPGDAALGSIVDANRDPVAQTQETMEDVRNRSSRTLAHRVRLANTALIVKCVNNHGALVKALEEAPCTCPEVETGIGMMPGHTNSNPACYLNRVRTILARAKR